MFKSKVSVIASLLLIASASMAADWAVDGKITGSPHDLSLSATGAEANGELCVFCHTPHAANSAFSGAPLWNKSGPAASTTYLLYGANATGSAGKTIAGTAVGSATGELSNPSLACLSCHDGVSAINSIVNAPGSGMGALTTGGTGGAVTMLDYVTTGTLGKKGGNIGAGGAVTSGTASVDMSNDHPVSIEYKGLANAGSDNSAYGSPASLRPKTAILANTNSTGGLWVGGATIQSLLRGATDNVECSSCHDPHNGYGKTADQGTAASPQVSYLRYTNAKSVLCLGCHDK